MAAATVGAHEACYLDFTKYHQWKHAEWVCRSERRHPLTVACADCWVLLLPENSFRGRSGGGTPPAPLPYGSAVIIVLIELPDAIRT